MRIKGLVVVRAASFRADSVGGSTGDAGLTLDDNNNIVPREDGTLADMIVRFSPFDTWYEINSFWEGRFIERTLPGAFKKTASDAQRSDGRYSTKSLFDHGMDMNIGDKPLGVPTRFEEVNTDGYHGPELEVPLIDTSYNRDIAQMLRSGALGSSFMFEPIREEWDNEPEKSDYNPEGLPERSITEVRTFEAGPVTWPASPTATAGLRSLVDPYMAVVEGRSSARHETMVASWEAFRAMHRIPAYNPNSTPTPTSGRQVDTGHADREQQLRSMRLRLLKAGR